MSKIIENYNNNIQEEQDTYKKDLDNYTTDEDEYTDDEDEYTDDDDEYTDDEDADDDDEYTDDEDTDDEYNDMYVITIDDKPYFYELTINNARNKLLEISKKINNKINENDCFNSYVCHKIDDEITIVNQLDFIFITKRYVLHTLKIHRIIKN